ncbi:MAG: hypothetical protein ACOVQA_14310, partial [Thermoflexibacteraceae bacterium]
TPSTPSRYLGETLERVNNRVTLVKTGCPSLDQRISIIIFMGNLSLKLFRISFLFDSCSFF